MFCSEFLSNPEGDSPLHEEKDDPRRRIFEGPFPSRAEDFKPEDFFEVLEDGKPVKNSHPDFTRYLNRDEYIAVRAFIKAYRQMKKLSQKE